MPQSRALFLIRLAIVLGAISCAFRADCQATNGLVVYNVKSYGAAGTGSTDDSLAVQAALVAAINNGGGVVYFPAGIYRIDQQIPTATAALAMPPLVHPTIARAFNLTNITLKGDGVGATQIRINQDTTAGTLGSITVTAAASSITAPGSTDPYRYLYHAGLLEDFTVLCYLGESGGQTGLISKSSIGLKYHNLIFSKCGTGLDMQNVDEATESGGTQKGWHERNDLDNVTFYNNQIAVHQNFVQTTPLGRSSFGYNSFRINVKTDSGTAKVFQDSGGGTPYNSYYEVSGSIYRGTTVFDAHNDGAGNILDHNTYLVHLEDGNGSGTSTVFNGTGAGSGVTGQFNAKVGANTQITPTGGSSLFLTDINGTPVDMDTLAPSSAATVNISDARLGATSACYVRPENPTAASFMSGTWIDTYGIGSAVLHKPSGAGAVYRLWCHP